MQKGLLALFAAVVLSGQTLSVEYVTLPQELIAQRIQALSDSNAGREQEVSALFAEAGCKDERLTEQPVKHAHDPNVVCTLPGATPKEIIVGAHFDFVRAGRGIVDNWSGCSLLPSLYQSLKGTSRRHTFTFIAFTDEEKGLVGSKFYVHGLSKDAVATISAMINLDSVGTGPTEFELERGDKRLAAALATIAKSRNLPWSIVNIHQVGRSDSDSFQDRHVPSLLIHSITQATWPILHSPRDQMAAIHLSDYYDTYRLLAAYLAYLDVTLDAPGATVN